MHDLIILGAGPGGYVAAERAAEAGLSTLLVEKEALGGTCLNQGCIPTKSLLAGAKLYKHAKEGAKLGLVAEGLSFDFQAAMAWKAQTVEKLKAGVEFSLKKAGVEILQAKATLTGPRSLALADGRSFEATNLIVATGSAPAMPPIPGLAGNPAVVDSSGLLAVKEAPRRLAIIGGGVIGMEFAAFYSAIGSEVTVLEMLPEILPFMDADLVTTYKRSLRGLKIETGAKVLRLEGSTVVYAKAEEERRVEADLILVATGRRPAIEGIGLETTGAAFSPRGITVDDELRATVPGLWAVGDVTGRALLAHSASAMGEAAVAAILGRPRRLAWKAQPWVVYGDPECAGCGLTEAEAQAAGFETTKAVLPARINGRFLAENGQTAQGCVKVLAEKSSGRLLGAGIVAPYAGEMIWGIQALLARSGTVDELKEGIFPHPSISELFKDAAQALEL